MDTNTKDQGGVLGNVDGGLARKEEDVSGHKSEADAERNKQHEVLDQIKAEDKRKEAEDAADEAFVPRDAGSQS
jgi:myo-inositol-hexaphosphate 3-phosphohydrolase